MARTVSIETVPEEIIALVYREIANMKITRFGAIGGVYLAENTILCYFCQKINFSLRRTKSMQH